MPIYKGDSNGKAIDCGAPGTKMLIGFNGKARRVGQIMFGDDQGIARLAYAGQGYREDDPYLLTCAEDFKRMSYEPYAFYKMTTDIEISKDTGPSRFYGVLDGDNHRLSFHLNKEHSNKALIYYNFGIVQNLAFCAAVEEGRSITEEYNRGLIYRNETNGIVRRCAFFVNAINCNPYIATNFGTTENCFAYGYAPSTDKGTIGSGETYLTSLMQQIISNSVRNAHCVCYAGDTRDQRSYFEAYGTTQFGDIATRSEDCLYGGISPEYDRKISSYRHADFWTTSKREETEKRNGVKRIDHTIPISEQCDFDFENIWEVTTNGYLKLQGLPGIIE